MASRTTSLIVKLGADISGLSGPLKQMSREIADAARKSQSAFAGFNSLGGTLSSAGLRLSAGLTAPLAAAGVAALKAAGQIETASTAFTSMTKNGETAKKLLGDIKQFAISTPFEFPGLITSGQKLLAFGFDASRVVPILKSVGSAVASVGGGTPELDRVTLALGQMQAKGKVSTQELNQLAEIGIPIREILGKAFGVTQAQLVALTEKGAIPAKQAIDALLAGFDQRFGGSLEAQSKTLVGIFSNLKDQVTDTAATVGATLAPLAKRIAADFVVPTLDQIKKLAEGFAALPASTQNVILSVTAIAAAAGPVLLVLGQLSSAFAAVATASGTLIRIASSAGAALFGLQSTAVAAAAGIAGITAAAYLAIPALIQLSTSYLAMRDAQADASRASQDADRSMAVTRSIILQRGGDIRALDAEYKKGQIGLAQYEKGLRDTLVTLTNQQGPSVKVAAATKEISAQTGTLAVESAKVAAVPLPEWFISVSDNARAAIAALAGFAPVSGVLQNLIKEEVFQRNQAAFRVLQKAITDLSQAGTAFGTKLDTDMVSPLDRVAAAALRTQLAINAARDTASAPIQIEVTQPGGAGGVFAAAIQEQAQLRSEANRLGAIYEQVSRQAGASSAIGRRAYEDWTAAEQKAAGVVGAAARIDRRPLVEVSTITTNLSQSLSRLIFDGGKFGETMVKVFKEIGQSITANLIQNLIKGSGLVDLLGKGLGGISKKIPGLGGLGGILGGGSSAAGSVIGSGGNAAAAVSQAASSAAMQTATLITGAVSAVSGIIGNFQQARTNKELGRIETTSRGQLSQAISQQETFNLYLPVLAQIHDRLKQIIVNGIGVYSQPQSVVRVVSEGFSLPGGASGGSSQFNFTAGEGVIIGGPYAEATMDWFIDRFTERLQQRGLKLA